MGVVVAVEGLDGAGKATLVGALADAALRRGAVVETLAFPRYDADVHAGLAGEALHGAHGDLRDSVHAMAVLFALDRAGAAEDVRRARATQDLVLVDRYVASNAAYGAARRGEDVDGPFVAWVHALEVERLGVPVPDAQVLVRVPGELAAQRVRDRAAADPTRTPDGYEADAALQARCAAVYDQLVERSWLAPWSVVGAEGDRAEVTRTAEAMVEFWLSGSSRCDVASGSSVRSDTIET
ncbi:dTMP kinase [Actinomycetospora cinnamomea]|uniref:Thymidylate kinase n=1 Tax=Actinomycetospora cinnamomea TaxID=663609 RepID=A0A2U1FRU3_9PSEU|nr:dTMP kinase [Actinomycetospora cinnamomea]PVZ14893.1 thymidylate kinase [Actinomycetospora cinnamomea]